MADVKYSEFTAALDTVTPTTSDNIVINDDSDSGLPKAATMPSIKTLFEDLTTKGDLLVYSTEQTRLPVGTDDYVLTADSSESTGLKWAAASGGGGDIVSNLANSEVSITSATTLTSTAFGKMHVIEDSGTPADYTVTLPAVSGNAGKVLGFRVDGDATKLFTLDGNSAEELDGETTRVMWAGESAILLCDGAAWTKISGKFIPMKCRIEQQDTSNISVTASTLTQVPYNTDVFDDGDLSDLSNNRMVARRSGKYRVFAEVRWVAGAIANRQLLGLYVNTAITGQPISVDERFCGSSSTVLSNYISGVVDVDAGEYVQFAAYQTSASTKSIYSTAGVEYPWFVMEEIPSW